MQVTEVVRGADLLKIHRPPNPPLPRPRPSHPRLLSLRFNPRRSRRPPRKAPRCPKHPPPARIRMDPRTSAPHAVTATHGKTIPTQVETTPTLWRRTPRPSRGGEAPRNPSNS
jgi:hypothetical protein